MAHNILPCARDQVYLLPPSLQDWLPEAHWAWFILDAVQQCDLPPFYAAYRADGRGAAAYAPAMMVSVLLYAYCPGVRSSRKIATACQENIAYRVLAGNQQPDHCTLARFRQTHEAALEGVFVEVLRLCAQAGLVKLGLVALDGTKIRANAALAANRTADQLTQDGRAMLREAAHVDAEENARYGPTQQAEDVPAALRGRAGSAGPVAGVQGPVGRGGRGRQGAV